MIWVGWRQQRTETLIAAGILALLAALLVPTGLDMANAYDHDGLVGAASAPSSVRRCGEASTRSRRASTRSATSLGWFNAPARADRRAARGAVPARARERHLPAGLDAEHHAPAAGSPCEARAPASRLRCVAAVAMSALFTWWRGPLVRPRRAGMEQRRLRLRGHRGDRLRALRARARARRRRRLAAGRAVAIVIGVRRLRRRCGSSSTAGCGSGSCPRTSSRGTSGRGARARSRGTPGR